jgi:uncharacterized membrane protein YheB (UPF0754 family)
MNDLSVDKNNLDISWEGQAELFSKYGKKESAAKHEVDRLETEADILKTDIKTEKSRVGSDFRDNWEEHVDKKPTEKAVEDFANCADSVIALIKERNQILRDLVEAKKELSDLESIRASFIHKREALKGLTSLFVGSYFGRSEFDESEREELAKAMRKTLAKNERVAQIMDKKKTTKKKLL